MSPDEQTELLGALRNYLEELKETGVEGLPLASGKSCAPPLNPASQVQAPNSPVHPASQTAASHPPVQAASQGVVSETLEQIRSDLGDCQRCKLCQWRKNIVFGAGNPAASLMFVGEGPGREEDQQGLPFVGEAGQLLTKMIEAMKFSRDEVYICNVIKCRPPENRNPAADEIAACSPFMLRQVEAVRPKVIVALGTFAAQTLLETKEPISRLRGRFHKFHGIPLMPTFHPAFLLRSPEKKREAWNDLQQVMKFLVEL